MGPMAVQRRVLLGERGQLRSTAPPARVLARIRPVSHEASGTLPLSPPGVRCSRPPCDRRAGHTDLLCASHYPVGMGRAQTLSKNFAENY